MLVEFLSFLRKLHENWHDVLRRHGLAFGLPSITGGVALDAQGHSIHWLSVLGIVAGILSSVGSLILKVLDYLDRKRARRTGR
jgi:hypothetical protein